MNVGGIDLNLLVALEALFAERSVTRAARRLGITQPAMSNSLRRLRVLLGDPVFVRTSEGMSPTPRALAIGPVIEAALNSIRSSISAPVFDPRRLVARFVIATVDYMEALYLPKLIGELEKIAPGVHLEVRRLEAIYEVPQAKLESGTIDYALGRFPLPMTPKSRLHGEVLGQEEWVCIGRQDHPGLREPLTLEAFANLHQLAVKYPEIGSGGGMIDRMLAARGLTRVCAASVPHYMTLPFHVAGTDCVAPMPRRLASFFARTLPLQIAELPIALPTNISLIWHSRIGSDPAHTWFRKVVMGAVV